MIAEIIILLDTYPCGCGVEFWATVTQGVRGSILSVGCLGCGKNVESLMTTVQSKVGLVGAHPSEQPKVVDRAPVLVPHDGTGTLEES